MLKARLYYSDAALSAAGFSALAFLVGGATAFAQVTYDVQVPYNLSGLSTALVSPRGIAVAPDGTVYVADVESASTGRVIMISPSGTVGGTQWRHSIAHGHRNHDCSYRRRQPGHSEQAECCRGGLSRTSIYRGHWRRTRYMK